MMIIERLLEKLHIRSRPMKLIIGSALTALVISLGMVGILRLFGFSVNPGIPAAVAAIGAAAYAARV
jgi:small-conductance mechanosensitive channel